MRIVFVLCEGPHDIAFLSRLLSADGYVKYKNVLSQFPKPLNQWFTSISKNLRIEDLSLNRMYDDIKAVLPSGAMENQERDHLVLFYSMNGDEQKDKRKRVIRELKSWTHSPADEKEFSLMEENSDAGNNYGLILLFDADEHGVDSRIETTKKELSEYFTNADKISYNGGIIEENENIKLGIYIFANPDTKTGTLENILLPIMKQGNEPMFDDAEDFLNKHYDESRLKPLIFRKHSQEGLIEKRDCRNKYHPIKSLMGVVGQLQNSGASNTVCIEKADYITLGKIKNSHICQHILDMFSRL